LWLSLRGGSVVQGAVPCEQQWQRIHAIRCCARCAQHMSDLAHAWSTGPCASHMKQQKNMHQVVGQCQRQHRALVGLLVGAPQAFLCLGLESNSGHYPSNSGHYPSNSGHYPSRISGPPYYTVHKEQPTSHKACCNAQTTLLHNPEGPH
jgi:hypothetical protein